MTTPLVASNSRVKEARKLSRRSVRSERRLFLAEGWKAIEAAASVDAVVEVYATEAAAHEHAALLGDLARPVHLLEDRALASLCEAVTPQGLVALCRFVDADPLSLWTPATRLGVICADVRDPGNAGTVIRTSDAAGADGIVLAGDSVDAYNPKTVRASVGSLFHLPLALSRSVPEAVATAQAAGMRVIAADGAGDVDLFELEPTLTQPTAWLFGNESWGLPAEVRDLADAVCRIPIRGRAESLNLATAAAVCLYASARAQR